jgi:hypothetical protein
LYAGDPRVDEDDVEQAAGEPIAQAPDLIVIGHVEGLHLDGVATFSGKGMQWGLGASNGANDAPSSGRELSRHRMAQATRRSEDEDRLGAAA